jgi:hypothetical protein
MLLCTENEAENAREYLISAFLKNLINYADNESMMIYNKVKNQKIILEYFIYFSLTQFKA